MGELPSKEEAAFNNLLKSLNDMEKGQKEMLEELKQQNQDNSVHRDFVFGETSGASHQCDHHFPLTHPHAFSAPTRTTLHMLLP